MRVISVNTKGRPERLFCEESCCEHLHWGNWLPWRCVCVCVRLSLSLYFFLLSLFLTLASVLYIFLHLTTMYSCTLRRGWSGRDCLYFTGMNVFGSFSLQESLHACTVCIWCWCCERARFRVEVLCSIHYTLIFIHSLMTPNEAYCHHPVSLLAS